MKIILLVLIITLVLSPLSIWANTDFNAPPKTKHQITPQLSFGSNLEVKYEFEKNYDLDESNQDDLSFMELVLRLAFSYVPVENVITFIDFSPEQEFAEDEEGKREDSTKLSIKQAFIQFNDLADGFSIKIGRQRFKDEREWIVDEELDAARFMYRFKDLFIDFLVGEKTRKDLLNDESDDRVTNYMLFARYPLDKDNEVSLYTIVHNDRTDSEENPIFYGLKMQGEWEDRLNYWLEAMHIRGRSTSLKIRGYGVDIGMTYVLEGDLEPSLTLGYAYGSGDSDASDSEDNNFRQTGFQDNDAKFNGLKTLKYYGEIFDPELSNLNIYTVGMGIRPKKQVSLDLVYHYFYQDQASSDVRSLGIDADPDGSNKDIGHEFDFIVGYKVNKNFKTGFTLGYFSPEDAFPDESDPAYFVELKLRYVF